MQDEETLVSTRATFPVLTYSEVTETSYLKDFLMSRNLSDKQYDAMDLSELKKTKNMGKDPFGNIADHLYKRYVRQQHASQSSGMRKAKKGKKNPNLYDTQDFIVDDEQVQKKKQESKYSDYLCLEMTIEQFYESRIYLQKLESLIPDENKEIQPERPPQIDMTGNTFHKMQDEIRNSIHRKIKGIEAESSDSQNMPEAEVNL